MALSPYVIVIWTKEDAPFNIVPNSPIEIRERLANGVSGNLINIFEADGTPITQPGGQTDSLGKFEFYADAIPINAKYTLGGFTYEQPVDVGITADSLAAKNYYPIRTKQEVIDATDVSEFDYVTISDRGDALFRYVTGETPNGDDIIDATGSGLQAQLAEEGVITTEMVGTTTDGVTEYVNQFISARDFNNESVEVPVGTYNVSDSGNFLNFDFHSYGPVTILNSTTLIVKDLLEEVDEFTPLKRTSLMKINSRRAGSNLGIQAPINVLGDSISHGAFAINLFTNSWVNLLKRMLNTDNEQLATTGTSDSSSYGFTPWFNIGTGPTLSSDIHISNNISGFTALENDNAQNILSGAILRSVASGGVIDYFVPTFQSTLRIYYIQQPGGGTFEIVSVDTSVVESAPLATIDTNGTQDNFNFVDVPIVDNGLGNFRYRVKSTSNDTVDIIAGAGYIANIEHSVVNNFSNSGRKLAEVDEDVIEEVIRGAQIFICALGHNDFAQADGGDDAYFAEFKQRVDWIIEYCNTHNTKIFWADFAWTAGVNSRTRDQMRRIEKECGGTYIPLPDYIRPDGGVIDQTYLTSVINLFEDAAHPNVNGHQWIAETLAKEIGLSVSSKKETLEYNDYWMPLVLDPPALVTNTFTTPRLVSSSKRSGCLLHVKIYIEQSGQAQFPVSIKTIQAGWNTKYGYSIQHNVSCGLAYTTSGGGLVHQINSTAGGSMRLNCLTLDLKDAIGTFILPSS